MYAIVGTFFLDCFFSYINMYVFGYHSLVQKNILSSDLHTTSLQSAFYLHLPNLVRADAFSIPCQSDLWHNLKFLRLQAFQSSSGGHLHAQPSSPDLWSGLIQKCYNIKNSSPKRSRVSSLF